MREAMADWARSLAKWSRIASAPAITASTISQTISRRTASAARGDGRAAGSTDGASGRAGQALVEVAASEPLEIEGHVGVAGAFHGGDDFVAPDHSALQVVGFELDASQV